jgi:hypothetical protein
MQKKALVVKMAISVDPIVRAKVLRAAREDKVSVSAWFTESARKTLVLREGLKEVAAWETENGAFTNAELASTQALESELARPKRKKKSE